MNTDHLVLVIQWCSVFHEELSQGDVSFGHGAEQGRRAILGEEERQNCDYHVADHEQCEVHGMKAANSLIQRWSLFVFSFQFWNMFKGDNAETIKKLIISMKLGCSRQAIIFQFALQWESLACSFCTASEEQTGQRSILAMMSSLTFELSRGSMHRQADLVHHWAKAYKVNLL